MVSQNLGYQSVAVGHETDRGLIHEPEVVGGYSIVSHSYVGWGAVIAGALSSLALLLLSASLAFACGVPGFRDGVMGVGAGVWLVITAIVAFFVGGFLVSYLSPRVEQRTGMIHGALAWVLAIVLLMVVPALAGSLGGGMTGFSAAALHLGTPAATGLTHGEIVGAAWIGFVSLAVGLIFAALGGMAGYRGNYCAAK